MTDEIKKPRKPSVKVKEEVIAPDLKIEPGLSSGDQMLAVINNASTDSRCDTDKMRALLDMKMELLKDDRKMAYNRAMHAAQAEMVPIVRKTLNESTRSKFAKLEHIDNIVRPIYGKHGFSISFDSKKEPDGSVTMFADVMHIDGHEKRHELNSPLDDKGLKGNPNKTQPQAVASTASILQRKITVMIFNLTFINEDDDGQGGLKKNLGDDPFALKAKQQANPKEAEPPTPANGPLDAAAIVRKKLLSYEKLEDRGKSLMQNVKLLDALEQGGHLEIAQDLRDIAEGKINE